MTKTVYLQNFLNLGNLNRCIKLRGIPYKAGITEIKQFLDGFAVNDDDIIIEQKNGVKTGFALVFLNSPQEVASALTNLNKRWIGQRFVEVMLPNLDIE